MTRQTFVSLGANWVVRVEWLDKDDAPRLSFFKLEMEESPSAAQCEALAALLAPEKL